MELQHRSNEHVRAELGQRLRLLRKSRGLTQADLAVRAGLSRPTVSTLERGNDVSLDTFLAILRALDLLDILDAAIAEPSVSPMSELADSPRRSQRRAKAATAWTWGDE